MNTMMLRTLLVFPILALSGASGETLLTADGNGADTYVRQGQPDNNFGAVSSFVLKGGNASTTRKGYLRFDLSSIDGPITDAILTLTVATNNSGGSSPQPGQTFNVDVFGLTNESLDNWVEGDNGADNSPVDEITYGNAPANLSPGNNFDGDALSLGVLNVPGTLVGETVTFSSPELLDFLNSDTNGLVTLLMRRQLGGSNNLAFRSKESDTPPQLDLTIGSSAPLVITDLEYDREARTVTLTWFQTGATSYTAAYSTDLSDWSGTFGSPVTADQDERPGETDTLTVTFDLSGVPDDSRGFFRIEESP